MNVDTWAVHVSMHEDICLVYVSVYKSRVEYKNSCLLLYYSHLKPICIHSLVSYLSSTCTNGKRYLSSIY